MFTLHFYSPKPSTQTFGSIPEIVEYVLKQAEAWEQFLAGKNYGTNIDGYRYGRVPEEWRSFAEVIRQPQFEGLMDSRPLQPEANNRVLIIYAGEIGQLIRRISQRFGFGALHGALRGASSHLHPTNVQHMDSAQLMGIGLVAEVLAPKTDREKSLATDSFSRIVEDLEVRASTHRTTLGEIEEALRNQLEQGSQRAADQTADYERWRLRSNDQVSELMHQWEEDWSALRSTFNEELRVRAPVKFWSERALQHTAKARSLRDQIIYVGLPGFAVVLLAGSSAVKWIEGSKVFGEDWHVQVFAMIASVALLSSLYLWLMRILVRLYISEVHLATDAEGRASIATTYLGLMKENAVSTEDRSIILTAIFRPPQDGIVKDDAMPVFTPGGLLTSVLAPK